MKRALLIVLDSVGCGAAPDAASYGDTGADTLGHILHAYPNLALPNLDALGLSGILNREEPATGSALAGRMREVSAGKDTTTGHWELAGVQLEQAFATYEVFSPELIEAIEKEANVTFIGNYACSGTQVLEDLGEEHILSGNPILYTSADSVIQIAAHEEYFGLKRLYRVCEVARKWADEYRIARVIARPFIGENGDWQRTPNRHDYSLVPPPTVLNALEAHGVPVVGIGKISDIFAASGVSASYPTRSNAHGMETIERLWPNAHGSLLFANLVDFDMLFGHRRDASGYADALEQFDSWLGEFLPEITPEDLVIITADHGNDPTFPGTDHTREEVPVFVLHRHQTGSLGTRSGFMDVAATLAAYFGAPYSAGMSMLA